MVRVVFGMNPTFDFLSNPVASWRSAALTGPTFTAPRRDRGLWNR